MANIITGIRIICALGMLASPELNNVFFLFYILGGITDILDGPIARKTGKANSFGAKFDTIADFIFAIVVIYKVFQEVYLPNWIYIWIAVILIIKITSAILAFKKSNEIFANHSLLNKVCGVIVFLAPFFITAGGAWQGRMLAIVASGILASIAAIIELLDVLSAKGGKNNLIK